MLVSISPMLDLSPEVPSSESADLPAGHADGLSMFIQWADRMVIMGEFSGSTVETYSTIWNAWLGWLAARELGWLDVDASVIQAYLDGPSPSLVHHRPALRADRMANYTRQRYWRVLRAVYAEAVRLGVLVSSPVLEVPEGDRPVIELPSRQSQVLPPGLLAVLRDPTVIEGCIPFARDTQWWTVRDRAAMLVLSHLGITTRELMALVGGDVVYACVQASNADDLSDQCDVPPSPAGLADATGVSSMPVSLAVARDDEVIPRNLELNDAVRQVLLPWLVLRRQVLAARLRYRLAGTAVSEQMVDAVCTSAPLFMSRQRSADQMEADRVGGSLPSVDTVGLLPPMEASNVYSMVKRCLDAVYRLPGWADEHPKLRGLNQASGAAIIRNTVLFDWVQTLGEETAALLGGLRSVGSLRVLPLV